MSASKHTPGPWFAADRCVGWEIHHGNTSGVDCWCERAGCEGQLPEGFRADIGREADARLIAAAPDQHDALMQWKRAEETGDEAELENARIARDAAIAKATGA